MKNAYNSIYCIVILTGTGRKERREERRKKVRKERKEGRRKKGRKEKRKAGKERKQLKQ